MPMALKEWAVVCEALGAGRQSVLLRTGGLSEGRGGFRFREREFLLFPTWFHAQAGRVQDDVSFAVAEEGEVEIRFAASLRRQWVVRQASLLEHLERFHIFTGEEARARFEGRPAGRLQVALVQVFRLEPPLRLAPDPSHGGCRSWIEIPGEAPGMVSVLSEEVLAELEAELVSVLGAAEEMEGTPAQLHGHSG